MAAFSIPPSYRIGCPVEVNGMRRINWKGWLILFLLLLACGIWGFFHLLRPVVLEYARNMVQRAASYAIHDTLTSEIYQNRAQYEQLVILERDDSSRITALKTDTILADYLKIQLVHAAYEALDTLSQEQLELPLGTILAPTLFAGRGPTLHAGIASLGYTDADFISAFTSAGINQTRHQILLEVRSEARLLTVFGVRDVKITSRLAVTDTVIVGTVPESYTYIDDTEQSLLGKVNDYAE